MYLCKVVINIHMKSFRQYVEGGKTPKFNRLKNYIEYYKNVSPKDFSIRLNGDTIVIKVPKTQDSN